MIWFKFNLKIKTVYTQLQDHETRTIISIFSPFSLLLYLKIIFSVSETEKLGTSDVFFSSHGEAFIVNHNHLSNTTQVLLMPYIKENIRN